MDDNDRYFKMGSISGKKFVQNVVLSTGTITDLLRYVVTPSDWPVLKPGENLFSVTAPELGGSSWTLTYFNRFGGL